MISLPLRNTEHPPPLAQEPARSGSQRHGDTTTIKRVVVDNKALQQSCNKEG